MYSRVGNKEKDYQQIGTQSYIRATSDIVTYQGQGVIEPTNLPLNFGIVGDGFFAVLGTDGQTRYTRAGDFCLDDEGYLCLSQVGQVLGMDGQPIQLSTDKITADSEGRMYTEDTGRYLGQVGVFVFDDANALEREPEGYFSGEGAVALENPDLEWKCIERSNVDMIKEMTQMMNCERSFQSAAQATKIYNELLDKATTELGRV
jgi:flagellar basal-body rod protein FlgG